MLVMLLSIVVSVLPRRYRGAFLGDANVDVQRGSILSGIAQIVVPGLVLWLRYPAFIHQLMADAAATVAAHTAGDKFSAGISDFSVGMIGLWVYILKPLNLFLIYLAAEGTIRLMAAATTEEVVPTLPLQIVAWAQEFLEAARGEIALGERVADNVIFDSADSVLRIESCRPKQWDDLTTVRYNDKLYELAAQAQGEKPRRFVYLLRPAPEHKVVRGLHDYDPAEPLNKE